MYTIIVIKKIYFFSLIYKNERKKNLDDKVTFTKKNKKIFNIDDTDVNKILVSKKEPYDLLQEKGPTAVKRRFKT